MVAHLRSGKQVSRLTRPPDGAITVDSSDLEDAGNLKLNQYLIGDPARPLWFSPVDYFEKIAKLAIRSAGRRTEEAMIGKRSSHRQSTM
jgi:hypothetical protein